MSFITEIMNPFLVVRNKIKNVNGNWEDMVKPKETFKGLSESSLAVDSTTNKALLNTYGRKTVIESFVVSTNTGINVGLHVSDSGNAWNNNIATTTVFRREGASGGNFRRPLNIYSVDEYGSDIFEILHSNDLHGVGGATIALKRPIVFPNGCRVNFYGGAETTALNGEVSYKIFWKEIEE